MKTEGERLVAKVESVRLILLLVSVALFVGLAGVALHFNDKYGQCVDRQESMWQEHQKLLRRVQASEEKIRTNYNTGYAHTGELREIRIELETQKQLKGEQE